MISISLSTQSHCARYIYEQRSLYLKPLFWPVRLKVLSLVYCIWPVLISILQCTFKALVLMVLIKLLIVLICKTIPCKISYSSRSEFQSSISLLLGAAQLLGLIWKRETLNFPAPDSGIEKITGSKYSSLDDQMWFWFFRIFQFPPGISLIELLF